MVVRVVGVKGWVVVGWGLGVVGRVVGGWEGEGMVKGWEGEGWVGVRVEGVRAEAVREGERERGAGGLRSAGKRKVDQETMTRF